MSITAKSPDQMSYASQLELGFSWLKFRAPLEEEYREATFLMDRGQLRATLALSWMAGAIFLSLDYFLYSPGFSNPALPYRTGTSMSLIVLIQILLCYPEKRRLISALCVLLSLNFGLVTLAFNTLTEVREGITQPVLGYMSVTFFIYFAFGLRFWQAFTSASLLYAGYLLSVPWSVAGVTAIYPVIFLTLTNLLGALGLYGIVYNKRQSYLLRQELKYIANRDPLTGLSNRRVLEDHLERVWAHCSRENSNLTVALVDIDYFKIYNDTYGHLKGDECLVAVGKLLAETAQRPLDMAARFGGEEFVLLLPECDNQSAIKILSRLKERLYQENIEHSGSRVSDRVSFSAGLVTVQPHLHTLQWTKLLSMADEALYKAKAKGRNCIESHTAESLPLQPKMVPANQQRDQTVKLVH